jgi:hypothetical protein
MMNAIEPGTQKPHTHVLPWGASSAMAALVVPQTATAPMHAGKLLIKGMTRDGKAFRPGDWSERLAGAMSCFRDGGAQGGIAAFIGYSPHCVPRTIEGVKCVLVSEALRGIEPMAWDFVVNFARDNELQVAPVAIAGAEALSGRQ